MEAIPKRFWKDRDWAFRHYIDLAKRYGNRWVAILNKKVVSAADSIKSVEKQARIKTGREHIPVIFVEKGAHVY